MGDVRDRLAVERQVHGPAHARVAEDVEARLRVRVHVVPSLGPDLVGAGDDVEAVRLQLLLQVERDAAGRPAGVEVAVEEGVPRRVGVRDHAQVHAVQPDVVVVPVAVPALPDEALPLGVGDELQVPGADGVGQHVVEVVRRDQHARAGEGLEGDERRAEGLRVDHPPGLVIHSLHADGPLDALRVAAAAAHVHEALQALHVELDGGGVDGRAVVEHGARPHVEDVGDVVGVLDALGQHARDRAVVFEAQHAVEDVVDVAQVVEAGGGGVRIPSREEVVGDGAAHDAASHRPAGRGGGLLLLHLIVVHGLFFGLGLRVLLHRLFFGLGFGLGGGGGGRGVVIVVVAATADQREPGGAHARLGARAQHRAARDAVSSRARPVIVVAHSSPFADWDRPTGPGAGSMRNV